MKTILFFAATCLLFNFSYSLRAQEISSRPYAAVHHPKTGKQPVKKGTSMKNYPFNPAFFDWSDFELKLSTAPTLLKSRYYFDGDVIRVIVTAKKNLKTDLLTTAEVTPEKASAAIKEAGLDAKLLTGSGAALIRTMDNTLTFEIPAKNAAKTGKILQEKGFPCRPSGAFHL